MLRPSEIFDAQISTTETRIAAALPISESLRDAWIALAQDASEPNAFAEYWFVSSALTHLRGVREVKLSQVWDGTQLIGVVALSRYNRYGRIPARHVSNWTHYQSFMGIPLIRRGHEQAFWRALIDRLDRDAWASGFLSMTGLAENGPVHQGLVAAAQSLGRAAPTVHRRERALLQSNLDAEAYLEIHVRAKKRKELRRLANRLGDLGNLHFSTLIDGRECAAWCDTFLALESAGWKGREGAALANEPATAAFFREIVASAFALGRLDFQRLDLDGRAIAMLVNFRTPPGSWSFKIAYDEALARFSPGVLIELENLPRVLGDPGVEWMDSCAVEDHPMINSLWVQRRAIVQVSVSLSGAARGAIYRACRAAETTSARLREMRGQK
jgi:CelD/BcsL family acetyltransferase involved in cellulose biosynthesis